MTTAEREELAAAALLNTAVTGASANSTRSRASSAEPRMLGAPLPGVLARPTGNGEADQALRDRRSRSI